MKLLGKASLLGVLAGFGATLIVSDPSGRAAGSAVEVAAHAQMAREQAMDDMRHVAHLQTIARRSKDIIKLNCVNDKLVMMKPQMNLIDRFAVEASGGNAGTAAAEIDQAGQNVRRLREEADQCTGEPLVGGAESYNSFTRPNIPDSPYENVWGTVLEAPAYASPFN